MSFAGDPRFPRHGYYRRVEVALVIAAAVHAVVLWTAPPYVPHPYKLASAPLRLVAAAVAGQGATLSETTPSTPASSPVLREPTTPVVTEQLRVAAEPLAPAGGMQAGSQGLSAEGESGPPVFYAFDSPPRITRRVYPEYTALAREAGAQGTVVVNANVDERGRIMRAWIAQASAPEILVQAALDAVYRFEFLPGSAHGIPVRCTVAIPFNFSLTVHP